MTEIKTLPLGEYKINLMVDESCPKDTIQIIGNNHWILTNFVTGSIDIEPEHKCETCKYPHLVYSEICGNCHNTLKNNWEPKQ